MSKLLATKVNTALNEKVQIVPKMSVFSGHHYFPTVLTLLGMELTRVSQVATRILFHPSITISRNWWMLRDLALLRLPFENAPQMLNRV